MEKQQEKQYFSRLLLEKLKKWVDRKEIFAIKGPRQSGKTTLLKMLRYWLIEEKKVKPENIIFITFEDRDVLEKFFLDPKGYLKSFIGERKNERFYFLIDEFHYLKNGGQTLKLLYDIFENVKFIITGSSSLELTGKTAKFLVGRVFSFELWQLNFEEFIKVKSSQFFNVYKEKSELVKNFILEGKDFSFSEKDIFEKDFQKFFEEYAIWGGYPEVIKTNDKETKTIILKNIYDTYITRDIMELLKITDYSRFKTLLALLSSQIGNLINYNNLVRDTQSYFKEIKHYFSILEETYIISLLKPFSTNKISELKKNPKVYFIDMGLRNYILGNFQELLFRPDSGQIVENAVFSQLKFNQEDLYLLKHWRTLGKAEVDFILERKKGIVPIEVKYSSFNFPKISRGFRSFVSEYKPKRAIILTKNFWGELKVNSTFIKFVPVWYL